jgi:hypothetical protein
MKAIPRKTTGKGKTYNPTDKGAGMTAERMRKPGTKGAPTAAAFKQSAKTAKK